jgi:hypothetical protein
MPWAAQTTVKLALQSCALAFECAMRLIRNVGGLCRRLPAFPPVYWTWVLELQPSYVSAGATLSLTTEDI